MRRRDCVRNLNTPLECARRHRQTTITCAYSGVALQCSVLRAHGWASRGLMDVNPREQIICHPRFEREIKLVMM